MRLKITPIVHLMCIAVWALIVISLFSLGSAEYFAESINNCTAFKSCKSCVNSDYECQWCNGCREDSEYCDSAALSTCNEAYYTIIFICVISCMVCICCCACYMRRRAMQRGETIAELLAPLIPSVARNYLFRNSLGAEGENEWMCIVCGFDNKPRSVHCTMCGTEHAFSQDYKEKKFEKHKQRKEKRLSQQSGKKPEVDIPIPEEAQITSVSMGLKYGSSAMGDTSMTQLSVNAAGREPPLTPAKRKEASNYRRLNQLSLRQKSARRRKTWQRRVDPRTGQLVWMRVPLSEVKVGSAPFGYTPRNSVDGKGDMYTQSLLHNNYDDSGNSRNNDYIRDLMYAAENANYNAGSSSNSSNNSSNHGKNGPVSSPIAIGGKKRQASKTSEDSFGDTHFVSGSPGYTSVFDEERGGLVWERVDQKRTNSRSANVKSPPPSTFRSIFGGHSSSSGGVGESDPGRAVSADNAGDTTSRSLFGLFSGAASPVPPGAAATSLSNPVGNTSRNKKINAEQMALLQQQYQSAANPQFDLEAVASMTYKEKLMWFLERTGELQVPWSEGFVKIEVRRSNVFLDSYHAVMSLQAADLHKWIRIQFKDEPGVDAGGLEREWFGLLVAEIFNPANGLFSYCGGDSSTGGAYHINPTSEVNNKQHLSYFRFVGRVLGKAMMEQQSIQANLSLPLRKQIISIPITFSDLEFVDDELYRNLIWLKTNDNVSNLMLDFSISYTNTALTSGSSSSSSSSGGVPNANNQVVYELKPGGADIPVTDANKEEYLQLRLRHRMLDSIKSQLEFFLIGLYEVIPLDLLSVFDYQELDLLLCGVPDIDVIDWHRHTEYLGEYNKLGARHPVIRWFWKAVEAMSHEERVRLLQFTTGCARLPAQGFKALQSNDGKYRKFNIQSISKLDSIYPRAHTCFNKLDLPLYDSENELEAYLSFVVNMESVTGFNME